MDLKTNICDSIKECEIKLGYQEETIHLYYPENTLLELLEATPENLHQKTDSFCKLQAGLFGKITIEETQEKTGKVKKLTFQWLTDLAVNLKNASEFANAGRGRWCIENQGFNIQKNIRYDIQHADSPDYNAMKCHYLLTQIVL